MPAEYTPGWAHPHVGGGDDVISRLASDSQALVTFCQMYSSAISSDSMYVLHEHTLMFLTFSTAP